MPPDCSPLPSHQGSIRNNRFTLENRPKCPFCLAGPFRNDVGLAQHIRQTRHCQEQSGIAKTSQASSTHNPLAMNTNDSQDTSGTAPEDFGMDSEHHTRVDELDLPGAPERNDGGGESEREPALDNPYRRITQDTAAYAFGDGMTIWEARLNAEDPTSIYAPFKSMDEFLFAKWIVSAGLSQGDLDQFFELRMVSSAHSHQYHISLSPKQARKMDLSFGSAEALNQMIERDMPEGVPCEWMHTEVTLPGAPSDPQSLFYRNVWDIAKFLLANPAFRGKIDFEPEEVVTTDGKRVYCEISSGKMWSEHQVRSLLCTHLRV